MEAILLIDHGSRRANANEVLARIADLVRDEIGDGTFVTHAHMELAEPTVAAAFAACVRAGADSVVAVPYFLFPGRHAAEDIPRMVGEAAAAHPGVTFRVAQPLGVHAAMVEVVLARAGRRTD